MSTYQTEIKRRIYYIQQSFSVNQISSWVNREKQLLFLIYPFKEVDETSFVYYNITDSFEIELNQSVLVSLMLSINLIYVHIFLYQAPSLTIIEQKNQCKMQVISLQCQILSTKQVYSFQQPNTWEFFLNFQSSNVVFIPSIKDYFKLSINIYFVFIFLSQVPFQMYTQKNWNVQSLTDYIKWRPLYIMQVICIVCQITPPDQLSLIQQAFPLLIIFEIFIYSNIFFKNDL